jgi:hypothetical protein
MADRLLHPYTTTDEPAVPHIFITSFSDIGKLGAYDLNGIKHSRSFIYS